MGKPRPRMGQRLKALASLPIVTLTFSGMWIAGKLGMSKQVFTSMGRGMQSPRVKTRAFQGYQPTARDVLVCTYSKSGTNWGLQIAYQIAHRGRGEFGYIHDVVPWPDAPLPDIVDLYDEATFRGAPTGMRVIKTHVESHYVPYHSDAKYIVIVRDPKEIFVSSYFFSRGMLPGGEMMPPADWLDMFLSDHFPYGSWAEHLAGYWPWRTRPNVLFLTFDEMKADLEGTVRRIAGLMGVELAPEELARVVEQSSFPAMKRDNHKFAPLAPFPFNKLLRQPEMIRKGERRGSAELLTPEQQGRIDRYMQAELRCRECDFPYAEYFVTVSNA